MIEDLPRKALIEILKKYGTSVIDDPRRLEAILRDYCAPNKREIYILSCAQAEGVPQEILGANAALPSEIVAARCIQRLIENRALSAEAAAWGVETWGLALNVPLRMPKAAPAVGVSAHLPQHPAAGKTMTSPGFPPPSQSSRPISRPVLLDLPSRYPGLFVTIGLGLVLALVGGLYWNLISRTSSPKTLPHLIEAYNAGMAYQNQGKYDDAVNAFSTAIAGDANYTAAYLERGKVFLADNNLKLAEADLTKALELSSGNAETYLTRGRLYARQKKDLLALDDLSKAIELQADLSEAYILRGKIYQDRGETQRALNDFSKSIELDPDDAAEAYLQRGILYAGQEEHAKAIADFDQVLAKDKGNALAYYRRALSRTKTLDVSGAIADMNSAIALDDHNGGYFYQRGLLDASIGETDQALQDFSSSIELYPTQSGAYYQRALVLVKSGKLEDAVNDFTQVIRLSNSSELVLNAYLARAYTRSKLGDMEGAVYDAQRTVDQNDKSAEAWNSLCWLGSLAGKAGEVMNACDQAILLAPDNGNYRDSRGVARALKGNYSGAVEDIKAYLAWKKSLGAADADVDLRKSWLVALQKGKNPINERVIQILLKQNADGQEKSDKTASTGEVDTGPTSPTCDSVGQAWKSARDGVVMLCVPQGEFSMGSAANDPLAYPNEKPVHTLTLDAYWIDRTEVTNRLYARCVTEGVCRKPAENSYHYFQSQFAEHPVLVGWDQAQAYCLWAGKRLPSEAEWEKAARDDQVTLYPWGEEISCEMANYAGCTGDTRPAGSYPDYASPYGVLDMAGNAWEWVQDWYAQNYYQESPAKNPAGPETGERHVLRGGGWDSYDPNLRTTFRNGLDEGNQGFRCVQTAR